MIKPKSICVKELRANSIGHNDSIEEMTEFGDMDGNTRIHTAPDYLYIYDAAITRAINKERNDYVELGLTVARDQLRENVKNEIGYNIETGEVVK